MIHKKIYIIAGEISGDYLGGALISALKKNNHYQFTFIGIGGPKMEPLGFHTLFPIEDISFMGLIEIIPHIFSIKKRIQQTIQHILKEKPDLIITIDAQGFCKRVIKEVKEKTNIPAFHYVAPQIWAWKENRVTEYAKIFDILFCTLPFEPILFKGSGLPTFFVGHPIIERKHAQSTMNVATFKKKMAISDKTKIIACLPGSRKQEVKRHIKMLKQLMIKIYINDPNCIFYIPTLPYLKTYIQSLTKNLELPLYIIDDEIEKIPFLKSTHIALSASGTAALELAMYQIPMIIFYKVNLLTYLISKKLLKTPYINLVNIIFYYMKNKRFSLPIIPEFVQKLPIDKIYDDFITLMNTKSDLYLNEKLAFKELHSYLQIEDKAPSEEVARHIYTYFENC